MTMQTNSRSLHGADLMRMIYLIEIIHEYDKDGEFTKPLDETLMKLCSNLRTLQVEKIETQANRLTEEQ